MMDGILKANQSAGCQLPLPDPLQVQASLPLHLCELLPSHHPPCKLHPAHLQVSSLGKLL